MNQRELQAKIDAITRGVEDAIEIDGDKTPEAKIFGVLLLTGVALLGELLLDIKRIADAIEPGSGK